MDRHGVEHAVLVQIDGQTDNGYQREVVRRLPGRFACVVMVNVADPSATEHLKREADLGACGVRLHPDTRSPGGDPLHIWHTAAQLGLSVNCGAMTAAEFATDEFARLVAALPRVPIVLEHLGGGVAPVVSPEAVEERRRVFALERFPNVYLKVHGLGEFCRRALPVREPFPFETPILPLLDMALEAFGAERLMWGSDYPLVSAREGYGNALALVRQQLARLDRAQRELIFGQVALRLFEVIRSATQRPAEVLGLHQEVGSLAPGRRADIALLRLEEGRFSFHDTFGNCRESRHMLRSTLTIVDGRPLPKLPAEPLAPWIELIPLQARLIREGHAPKFSVSPDLQEALIERR